MIRSRRARPVAAAPGLTLAAVLIAVAGCTERPSATTVVLPLTQGWTMAEAGAGSSGAGPTDAHGEPGAPGDTVPRAGDAAWVPATVPGTVHTDLLAAGLIPDPYAGANEDTLQWIEDRDWVYHLSLDPPEGVRRQDRLDLVFDGLDTYAAVTLNGDTVLEADNMFRSWRVDVASALQPGANTLEVHFRSPIAVGERLAAAHAFPLPQGSDAHDPPTRAFTRKAAYQYGWDWGPRFVTSGIWRPARLEAWSGARIADTWVRVDSLDADTARARVLVTVEATAEADARLQIRSDSGAFEAVGTDVHLEPGTQTLELPLRIARPRLWWPAGMGEPHLYRAEVSLSVGRRLAADTVDFGLRTVRLVTEPDSVGESFYFEVNGRPLFARGANLVPLDHFTPRVDSADFAALFDDVARAGMNMLRVWGGGVYPRDLFYDMADRRGILIWQDFMFANALYPADPDFLASVRAEATDQVRRLRNHPSLALWCGNNEIDEGWHNWGWQRSLGYTSADSTRAWADYRAVFEDALPGVVAQLDPGVAYRPSSPSIGWGHPESLTRGDSHYWGVWWGMEPFSTYAAKVPRFASEFGFQGMPDLATVRRFAPPEHVRMGDALFDNHEKHPTGFQTLRTYLARDLVVPPDSAIRPWIYATQLLQARGMRVAFEAQRRARPRAMGTLYWQLNDTWPVVSWSSRDHEGRLKMLHYAAAHAFAPLLVSPVLQGDSVQVWVVDDEPGTAAAELTVTGWSVEGDTLAVRRTDVATPDAGSARVLTVPVSELLNGVSPERAFVTLTLHTADGRDADNVLYLVPLNALELPEPEISHRALLPSEGGPGVELTTRYPAHFVHLDVPGAPLEFDDDGFLVLPGQRKRVTAHRLAPKNRQDVEVVHVTSLAELLSGGL